VLASGPSQTSVHGAGFTVVTVVSAKLAAHQRIAGVRGAGRAIRARDVGVHTRTTRAPVKRAEIVVIARHKGVLAARRVGASIKRARVAIITVRGQMSASRSGQARVHCAGFAIIAVNCKELASVLSRAGVRGAEVVIVACGVGVNACANGVACVDRAGVAI
jgi:hypothetical protein